MEREETQGQRNAEAYRQGVQDAAEGRNFGHPDRRYPTEEELAYQMGFYEELEVIEEEEGGILEEV